VTERLGDDYRLLEVSTKVHAGAGRLQAAVDAGLALGAEHELEAAAIADVEIGIPKVIQGRLTHARPPDLQSAQLSVPLSLAMALVLGRSRGPQSALRREDYERALASREGRALAERVRCVLDAEVEAGTNTEEVPAKVAVRLRDGRTLHAKVDHPRGSPHRRMSWEELSALFRDAAGAALPAPALQEVLDRVAGLDRGTSPRAITACLVVDPAWLRSG